ncbi:hypothetical protein DE146DRAFT_748451 [Phaeosphaeria sp. MPI-PUGE-AT-0046c]|nr:hypothetical protein DE146DRAFT_748451 [Phaeosphaeria sp. MPI-PUGE-AT-0046c]
MRTTIIALGFPLLAFGAQHAHNYAHRLAYALADRAIYTEVVTVNEILTITIDTSSITSSMVTGDVPLTSAPANSISSKSLDGHRIEPTTVANDNPFPSLVPVANSAIIKNSCEYPVYIWSMGHESCNGPAADCELVQANSTYTEPLRKCSDGGVSLKISKDKSAASPMQFEYSVWSNEVMVSYDISYLVCMNNENGEKDLSGCAGHDGGIQAVGGGDCPDYHCTAGKWCDQQAYVVVEFDYLPDAPVGGCTVDKGIAFELCAGNRG